MNTTTNQSINVGVDTGKFQLDIFIRPLDIYFTVTNDEQGIKLEAFSKSAFSRQPSNTHAQKLSIALDLISLNTFQSDSFIDSFYCVERSVKGRL